MASSNFWGPKCHKTPSTYSLGEMLEKKLAYCQGARIMLEKSTSLMLSKLGLGSSVLPVLCLGFLLLLRQLALEQLAKEEKSYATRSGM